MKNTKRLLINTLTLAATSFLMRTVGVAFNVYLTGRLGAAGIGLFRSSRTCTQWRLHFRLRVCRSHRRGSRSKIPEKMPVREHG